RNRRYFEAHAGGIALDPAVDPTLATLLFDPQTSGGLLITVPDEDADAVRGAFARRRAGLWEIGRTEPGPGSGVDA
ncbi:MAG TPA: AIR synthase-related protein, partial [Thermomicrobiales bacterium]|nr:AIR synthase-related protein [Thermomicrobiales bacterium]